MLSRRNLRVKVMQVLYAHHLSSTEARKNLMQSIQRAYQIYLFILHQLIDLHSYGEKNVEFRIAKLMPTEEDLQSKNILVENKVVLKLLKSDSFRKSVENEKLHLRTDERTIRSLYKDMTESEEVKKYALLAEHDFKEDRNLIVYLIKKLFDSNEPFNQQLEEIFINYQDDAKMIIAHAADEINLLTETQPIEKLLNFENRKEEDDFAVSLLDTYLDHEEELQKLIEPKLVNWDLDRVASIDLMLMKLALCEMMYFATIPLKVSLNEYIDISKVYSTPKSKEFINGILDNIMKDLRQNGKINKAGRGLVE